ncbi:MAG TPA: PLP-dependent aminotransferase family protein, partial [Methylomirabilota bacterium]|nr:PLP-dependent aminotransferase family protein [Methylomirabilota bacterium]
IVEDGFDGTLFYGERPPAPLKAADASGQVIYLGSFSKILFPGLRLGWIVASPELIERLDMAKQLADIHTSPLIQAAVYHFCRQRLLDRHQARVLREYARRRGALLAALGRRMPDGVRWTETQGGFSLLVELPEGMETAALLPRAVSAAWPSRRAMPSSRTAGVSGRCDSPSRPCPSPRSKRACDVSPTAFASSDVTRSGAPASAGPPCPWSRRSCPRGLRDPGRARRP